MKYFHWHITISQTANIQETRHFKTYLYQIIDEQKKNIGENNITLFFSMLYFDARVKNRPDMWINWLYLLILSHFLMCEYGSKSPGTEITSDIE